MAMNRREIAAARFTHVSDQENAGWSERARSTGNEKLAREHDRYGTGSTHDAGNGFFVVRPSE